MKSSALYLGFGGHGNLGDDVIRDVIFESAPDISFHELAVRRLQVMMRVVSGSTWRNRGLPLLVGGGTILGRELWRGHFSRLDRLYRPSAWEMLGIGVEDPDFRGDRTYTSRSELTRWRPIIDRFGPVTVRGPRSQEVLEESGVGSEIVGDPALLYEVKPWEATSSKSADILVNVTCGEDQWGGTGLDWTPTVSRALSRPSLRDYKIRFLSMEPTDDEWIARVNSDMKGTFEVVRPQTVTELAEIMRDSSLLIGTRLHSNVIAAAIAMPSISLEYRPKCRDFMRSVGQERYTMRVDQVSEDWLAESVEAALSDGQTISDAVHSRVSQFRQRLRGRLLDIAQTFKSAL